VNRALKRGVRERQGAPPGTARDDDDDDDGRNEQPLATSGTLSVRSEAVVAFLEPALPWSLTLIVHHFT
jgi:hypothetical protein